MRLGIQSHRDPDGLEDFQTNTRLKRARVTNTPWTHYKASHRGSHFTWVAIEQDISGKIAFEGGLTCTW